VPAKGYHDHTTINQECYYRRVHITLPEETCMTGESILIVEDEGIIALQLTELLENHGYRIAGSVASGEDAVSVAKKDPPDLICMDIELMGKIDGIEAARQIHQHADIPVIYLTAYSDSQRVARAKETAPYSYIVKPFNERELLATVDMVLYRHKIDCQLRESMQRYRAIVDNASEGILLVSRTTRTIIEANPASIRLFGYTPGELSGMSVDDLIATRDWQEGSWAERICTSAGWSGEVQFRCRDGSLREVEFTSRIIYQEGTPALTCMVAHDVTDRKRAEVAVRLAHRKLNLLSSITRHDILNQLTVLSGYLELSGTVFTNTRLREYVDKEKKAATAIRRMIDFTKDFEEIGQQKSGWHKADAIIRQLVKTANFPAIMLDSRIGGLELYADPLIERVFNNLLDNAVRHGEHVKKITVTAEPADSGLVVRWEDDGVGVPDTEKKRIFERGFGKNTGLGLFLAREILDLTGISIRETGTFGSGARFEMIVPFGSFRYPAGG
jgi:PAS domain S-box-containing protein